MSLNSDGEPEEFVATRPNKRKYHVTRKPVVVRDKRKALMPEITVYRRNFVVGIPIPEDFICAKCKNEILGSVVFIRMSDNEKISPIREEKEIFHRECIEYSTYYATIGILVLREERLALDNKGAKEKEIEVEQSGTLVQKVHAPPQRRKKRATKKTKKTGK